MPRARSIPKQLQQIRDASEQAKLIGNAIRTANELTEVSIFLIEQALFEELLKAPGKRDQERLVKYMTFALKTPEQILEDKSLMRGKRRLGCKTAECVVKDAVHLREIVDSSEDEPAKIEKVMLLLFGPEPAGFATTKAEGE